METPNPILDLSTLPQLLAPSQEARRMRIDLSRIIAAEQGRAYSDAEHDWTTLATFDTGHRLELPVLLGPFMESWHQYIKKRHEQSANRS